MADEPPNDDAVDDPVVEMKQSELNKLLGKTRTDARATTEKKLGEQFNARFDALEAKIAPAAAAAPAAPMPAAAPSAPSTHSRLPTDHGLPNIFAPGVAATMSPREVRKALEQIWSHSDELSNKPERPKPPKR